jgi:hypothetical protein
MREKTHDHSIINYLNDKIIDTNALGRTYIP